MRIPIKWLSDYVDISTPPRDIAHRLTMAGLEIAGVEDQGELWGNVFVGYVEDITKHPNADRLRVCSVNIGDDVVEVVCGAPNVDTGQKIALARVGARLLNPATGEYEKLKSAKIRGIESHGMICSERELGIGEDHSGILVLSESAEVGTPLSEYFGGVSLELEATPNRPDAMSLLGVARELAALSNSVLKVPSLEYSADSKVELGTIEARVDEADLCPRYLCVTVQGVKVTESPDWIQQRLRSVGQRPINNVVDITNYVMFELGQPLHAFDANKIGNGAIVVRKAVLGETIDALDGNDYVLSSDDLVIADFSKPIAIAGIIGGRATQVDNDTVDLVLEAASFAPATIRRTSRRLGIRTDASNRFEKGLRPRLPEIALRRACRLLEQIAGGTANSYIHDLHDPDNVQSLAVRITRSRIRAVLGVEIHLDVAESVLNSLGFELLDKGQDYLEVAVPPWRSDVTIEEDLLEEVARIVGYDSIPAIPLASALPQAQPSGSKKLRDLSVDILVAAGMQQIITYPLVSQQILDSLPEGLVKGAVKVLNPMTTEHEFLRTSMRPSSLQVAAYNYRRQSRTLRLFESGRTFFSRPGNLPLEKEVLVGLLGGERWDGTWIGEKGKLGFFDAKGVLELLFGKLGLRVKFSPAESYWMYPGRTAEIKLVGLGNIVLGVVGEVSRDALDAYGLDLDALAMFEIDLDVVYENTLVHGDVTLFDSFSRTPGVYRDLSLLADNDHSSGAIREILENHPLVVSATLFDLYEGEGKNGNQRVLGYRLLFQSVDNTLTTEEVSQAESEILKILESQLGISLRS